MTFSLALNHINHHTCVWFNFVHTDGVPAVHEVYSGAININLQANDKVDVVYDDGVWRNTFAIFLPFGPLPVIRGYLGPVHAAPLVTVNGFVADDLHFIASIDRFEIIELKDRRFRAPDGTLPTVLALKFTAAVRRGTLFRVGYNVTVVSEGELINIEDVRLNTSPVIND